MSADQLLTLCLEELNPAFAPSNLILRIIKNPDLSNKMLAAAENKNYFNRHDNPRKKVDLLGEWQKNYHGYLDSAKKFKEQCDFQALIKMNETLKPYHQSYKMIWKMTLRPHTFLLTKKRLMRKKKKKGAS